MGVLGVKADIGIITATADMAARSTKAMSESFIMARDLFKLYDNGVLSVDRGTVHMTEESFNAIPWEDSCVSIEPRSAEYDRKSVFVDEVMVFCLVKVQKNADEGV